MIVKIPRLSGFCPGVKAAEKRIFAELESSTEENHSVLGMMINNRRYIEYLKQNEIDTVEDSSGLEKGSTLFIRTHGIAADLQSELDKSFKLIDLTCRNVKRVQEIIKEHSDSGAAVIITGKKSHPETIGLKSYGKTAVVLETSDELENFIEQPKIDNRPFDPSDFSEIFITSQTTGNRSYFETAIDRIKKRWPESKVDTFNSICPVTEKKELEALEIQKEVDISFVIGDPLSSNASKLYKRLSGTGLKTLFIQDSAELKDLKLDFTNLKSALVVSSASTPKFVEDAVVQYLENC